MIEESNYKMASILNSLANHAEEIITELELKKSVDVKVSVDRLAIIKDTIEDFLSSYIETIYQQEKE